MQLYCDRKCIVPPGISRFSGCVVQSVILARSMEQQILSCAQHCAYAVTACREVLIRYMQAVKRLQHIGLQVVGGI